MLFHPQAPSHLSSLLFVTHLGVAFLDFIADLFFLYLSLWSTYMPEGIHILLWLLVAVIWPTNFKVTCSMIKLDSYWYLITQLTDPWPKVKGYSELLLYVHSYLIIDLTQRLHTWYQGTVTAGDVVSFGDVVATYPDLPNGRECPNFPLRHTGTLRSSSNAATIFTSA